MQIQYRHDETVQVYRQCRYNAGMMRQYKYTDNIKIIQVCTVQACRDSTSIQTMQIQCRHDETEQVYRQYKHHTSMHNTGMQRQYKYTSGGSRKLRTGGGRLRQNQVLAVCTERSTGKSPPPSLSIMALNGGGARRAPPPPKSAPVYRQYRHARKIQTCRYNAGHAETIQACRDNTSIQKIQICRRQA